jgi:PKD repeat protein
MWPRLVAVVAACAISGVLAPAASAVLIRTPTGHVVSVMPKPGVAPSSVPDVVQPPGIRAFASDNGNLQYQGGRVLHTSAPYLVFWDPNNEITTTTRALLAQYFSDLANPGTGGSDTFRVLRQYTDSTGGAATGETFSPASQSIADNDPYPTPDNFHCETPVSPITTCVTDTQIRTELVNLITGGLPAGAGANAPVYFVITPVDINVCAGGIGQCAADNGPGGFCAYHDSFQDGTNQVLYASIPVLPVATPKPDCQGDNSAQFPDFQTPNSDIGDGIADMIDHEYAETITDPLVGSNNFGWLDPTSGEEVADNCESYGPGPDPANGVNPNAYVPVLGGSPSGGPTLPGVGATGTSYDQAINGHPYYTQTLWSNGDVNCKADPTPATLSPAFTVTPTGPPGTTVNLDPGTSAHAGAITSSTWDFGDGSASIFTAGAAPSESHHYSQAGTYPVTLTLVDVHGNLTTTTRQIGVGLPPTAAFAVSPVAVFVGASAQFNGAATKEPSAGVSVTSYRWQWGDATPDGAGASAAHSFSKPGQYNVTLTVVDSDGMTSSVTHQMTVLRPAAFTVSTTRAPTNAPISFSAASLGAAGTTYRWAFGDGSTAAGATATHRYAHGGRYTVKLIVTGSGGGQSTATETVTITGRITKVTITKAAVLHVTVSGPGTLQLGAKRVSVRRFGTVAIKLALSAGQKHRLHTGGTVALTIKLTFVPVGGTASHLSKKVTLRA